MTDLNHSGIYNTQNSQQTLCVRIYIFESCGDRMSENEQSQQREENANIDLEEKNTQANIDVYGSLLEGKRHQSLVKPDKIKFLKELKRTEVAKQKHGVNTIYTPTYV